VLEASKELAAKHRRECGHGKEKPAARSDPVPIGGECAGGDEGVDVQVLGERLAPGVQHQGGGDGPACPTRVLAELDEGVRDALEQPDLLRGHSGGRRVDAEPSEERE
jgi:hypothetical protein